MGEFDVDTLVLDILRKQTGQASAGMRSRFTEDLGLSDNGRNALFAFLVEAFSARGVNLPSRGFFLSDFLKCTTVAEAQAAIRDAIAGVKKKASAAAKGLTPVAPGPTTSAPAAAMTAPSGAPAPASAKATKKAAGAGKKKARKRKA
jgi:hypothetical protein